MWTPGIYAHARTQKYTGECTAHPRKTSLTAGLLESSKQRRMARAKKKVTCQDCDRTFSRKGELQQHRREEHSRRNMCLICKRAFESEKRLKMHLQFHNVGGKYKCFYCSKQFNKAWKMKIHLVNHSGRPSYICEYCGDDFVYPGKIVTHLKQIHDVYYACKDCGYAIPIECSQEPHKCRIYGCKDCLMSFTSESELAGHVNSEHADQGINTQCAGYQGVRDPPKDTSPATTGTEEDDDCDLEPVLVVAEETSDSKAVEGISRLDEARVRMDETPRPASHVSSPHTQDSNSPGGGSCSPVTPEERCDSRPQYLEANNRLSHNVLVNPPGVPVRRSVPYDSVRERRDMHALTLLIKGRRAPAKSSVIRNGEKEEEGRIEKEEGKGSPPSYVSSVLLRSPSIGLSHGFKVPEALAGVWKKPDSPASKLLRRKQDELDRALKKRELLNTLHLYMDTDARLTQCNQTSFESWLTADSFSSPEHDYVFGYEASVSVGSRREEAHYHYHYFNKKIPKKEKVDMTFEDLCLF